MGVFGRPVAIAFFLMMGFAALTSCVSVMETLVANCMELYHKSRKKMCGAVGIYSLVTAVLICLVITNCILNLNCQMVPLDSCWM